MEDRRMTPSHACYDIIKKWEGLVDGDPDTPGLDAYLCPANYATIGWGHVLRARGELLRGETGLRIARQLYPNGITLLDAQAMLAADVAMTARGIERYVKVPITQTQFDALVSFAYNVGLSNFSSSTMVRLLNAGNARAAADEFPKWISAGGRVLTGLKNRRAEERALFLQD
jgi:lysozyme